MAEPLRSDRLGRYVTHYDGNDYISCCTCVRSGRKSECRCGEDQEELDWTWDLSSTNSDTKLQHTGREAIFHPSYSSGTAGIRGTEMLSDGQHFWEIKMTTPVYGTDMMIGVGTRDAKLTHLHSQFASLLGQDEESWGFSYQGTIHHNGTSERYTHHRLGQGSIVGIHLDTWLGTLSYFLNREPLGLAFGELRHKNLYPVISSTAARSGMKVIATRSYPTSLQFMCAQALRRSVRHDKHVLDTVPVPPGLSVYLRKQLDWLLRPLQAPFPSRQPMRRGRFHEHGCRCDRASCNNCFSPLTLASLGPVLGPAAGTDAPSVAFPEQSESPPLNSADFPCSTEPSCSFGRSEEPSRLPAARHHSTRGSRQRVSIKRIFSSTPTATAGRREEGHVGVTAAAVSAACSEISASEVPGHVGGCEEGSTSSGLFPATGNRRHDKGMGQLGDEAASCGEGSTNSSKPEAADGRLARAHAEATSESLQPGLLLPGYVDSEREFMVIGRNNANDPDDNSNDSLSFPLPRGHADYLSCLPVVPLLRDIDDNSSSPLPAEYSLSLPPVSNVVDQQYQRLNSLRGSGWVPPSPEVDDPESLPDQEYGGTEETDKHFPFEQAAAKRLSAFDDVRATATVSCKAQHSQGAGSSKHDQLSTASAADADGLASGAAPTSAVHAVATKKLNSGGSADGECLERQTQPSTSSEVTVLVTQALTNVKDAVAAAAAKKFGTGTPSVGRSQRPVHEEKERSMADSQADCGEPSAKKQRRKLHQE